MRVRVIFYLAVFFMVSQVVLAEEIHMLYMAQAGYQPSDIIRRARSFEEQTGIAVKLSFVEYEDQYSLILESSEKPEAEYDVITVDLIWTAEFAEQKIIDPLPPELEAEVKKGIVPEIYSSFIYDENLWAMPFLANFQLMYTNMELLQNTGFSQPPETLEELVEMAEAAKQKEVVEYPLFLPLRKQEALICVLVMLTGAYGGDLTDATGRINVDTPASRQGLGFLVDMLDRGLLNPYSLQQEEVFAAEVFTWGDSLFTMNWTYVLGLMKDIERPIHEAGRASLIPPSETVLEKGGISSTISGFQGLSVAHNSERKEDAWRFIGYLSSPDFQRMHLEEMSVWQRVWTEEKTLQQDPHIELKRRQILGVRNRPIHPRYREISTRLQYWVYEALRGTVNVRGALGNAQKEIEQFID